MTESQSMNETLDYTPAATAALGTVIALLEYLVSKGYQKQRLWTPAPEDFEELLENLQGIYDDIDLSAKETLTELEEDLRSYNESPTQSITPVKFVIH